MVAAAGQRSHLGAFKKLVARGKGLEERRFEGAQKLLEAGGSFRGAEFGQPIFLRFTAGAGMRMGQTHGHAGGIPGVELRIGAGRDALPKMKIGGFENILAPFGGKLDRRDPARTIALGPFDHELAGIGAAFGLEAGEGMPFGEGLAEVRGLEGIPAGEGVDSRMEGGPVVRCEAI